MMPADRRTTTCTATLAFLALPAGPVAAGLALTGRPERAARLWGGRAWTGPRALARVVLGLPLDVPAFLLLGFALVNSVRNLGYPLWYAGTDYHDAWGGPTMAGIWAVHAGGWALCLYVLLRWPVAWLAAAQRALGARLALPTTHATPATQARQR
ncbi:hypothetical protein ACFPZF_11625 [Kitasatospora cinereorecta]|uniref:Uncharacterized protein n=2 Tax=Kitasatospora cinereorecta TaxID=285560 RepID=A0ABW0V8H1_9ACTN